MIAKDEIEEVLADLENEDAPKVEESPKALRPRVPTGSPKLLTDVAADAWVEKIRENYPGLITSGSHWTMIVSALMHKINYRPPSGFLRSRKELGTKTAFETPYIKIVDRHISLEMLDDLEYMIGQWVEENPLSIKMGGVEGAIVIEEDDSGAVLSYDKGHEPVEESAMSKDSKDWGAW